MSYCSSGADQIQDVTTVVGGKVDMLSEAEAVEQFQEFSGSYAVSVDVDVEMAQEKSGR